MNAAVALGYLGLAFVLTWPLFTPSDVDRRWITAGDFSDQFYPFARYVADELAQWRLPLWNPFIFGGHPFLADPQTAVLYPVSSGLALLLGRGGLGYRALELELPLHFALAGFGTFLFARRASGSLAGGMLAGIAFGFGGFLTSYPAQQLAMLRTAAWLPWVLYCLARALGPRPRPAWLAGAAGAFGLAIVAGHSQTAMFIGYLAVVYALWRGRALGYGWRRALLVAATAPALGTLLAAAQLAPTIELVAISTRDRLPYDAAAYGYAPRALFGVLLPTWRGERALYVGAATLLLAALALGRGRAEARFWGGVAAVALVLSVGGQTFLYRLLYLVAPGWSTFRDQERTAAIWSFAVAVLAAHAVAELTRVETSAPRRWARWLAVATGASLVLGAEVLVLWTSRRLAEPNPFDALLDGLVFLTIVLALATTLLFGWSRLPRAVGPALLIGLAIFDLFSINGRNNLTDIDPRTVQVRDAALARPRAEPELYRLRSDDDKAVPPNLGMVWRTPMMAGDSPILLRRTHDLLESREEWRLWQLFNVKYLLSSGERSDPGLEPIGQADGLNVYAVRYSLPRAWAVSDVRVVPDPAAALAATLAPDIHPGDVAIVEAPPPLPIAAGLPRPDVRVTSSWPNGLELTASSTGNALVVIADAWHPGWRAELDGAPTPILRTNYAFRGIAIPPGDHRIVMRFRPTSLVIGGAITAAAALALALLALGRPRRLGRAIFPPERIGPGERSA